jgi:hypothetical protein
MLEDGIGGNVAGIRVKINAQKVSVAKPGASRPLGRPKSRREINITIYLRGLGWEELKLTHLDQD